MSRRGPPDPRPPRRPTAADDAQRELGFAADDPHSLVELVNRVLDRGVVVNGEVTISVAGVDLVYLGLNALLTSVSTARATLSRGRAAPPALRPPPAASEPAAAGALPSAPSTPRRTDPAPRGPGAPAPPAGAGAERRAEAADALAERLVEVADAMPSRVEIDPDGVQRDLGRLVLTIVELLRQVVEHQAVQRMEDPDLGEEQIERMGTALLRLEEKMKEIKAIFGLADEELNIDLGPLGKLL